MFPNRLRGSVLAGAAVLSLSACASMPPPPPEHPPRAEPMAVLGKADRPTVAFVLGGGGARGFAHTGALKVLDAAGISADLVVGTSAGSVVGALYAGGIRNDDLVAAALAVQREQLVRFVLPNRGFVEGYRLQTYLNDALRGRPMEALEIPFVAIATELRTGRLTAFNRGDTGMAVRASCSVPGIFQPTTIEGKEYVDGGLTSPLPAKVARDLGADIVIAVDVSRQPDERTDFGSTTAIMSQAIVVMEKTIADAETKFADVVIRPDLARVPATDLAARNNAIAAGEAAARNALPRILRLIEAKKAAMASASLRRQTSNQ